MESLAYMTGLRDRTYPAFTLPGAFYDPHGTGPTVRPHLEIPDRILRDPDPVFPDRLAEMGNGLAFGWWLVPEVTAVRRALFNAPKGKLDRYLKLVRRHRHALVAALEALQKEAAPDWSILENLLISSPEDLAGTATGDFSSDEVADFFPPAGDLGLHISFDPRLREDQGHWSARRIGVWHLRGETDGVRFGLGVLTPRLTANSLFRDELFVPARESSTALLVRGLVLRRLVQAWLSGSEVQVGPGEDDRRGGPRLRAVPARRGQKIPEASVEAAVSFLQAYSDAEAAWAALDAWSQNGNALTVTKEGFLAAYANARRFIARAEQPLRDDINVLLPIAWDTQTRVVRATFTKGAAADSDTQ